MEATALSPAGHTAPWSQRAEVREDQLQEREEDLQPLIPRDDPPATALRGLRMTWYGPETDDICLACKQLISANDVEVECDLPKGGTVRLHWRCYGHLIDGVAQLRGITCRFSNGSPTSILPDEQVVSTDRLRAGAHNSSFLLH